MSDPGSQGGKLYTLSDVSHKTGISMPTLQRYKKLYQGRIPSVGSGRKQRYPDGALPVFDEIKNENIGRRGRPRKDASAAGAAAVRRGGKRRGRKPGAAAAAKRAAQSSGAASAAAEKPRRGRPPGRRNVVKSGRAGGSGLLTLTQISKDTGISYPTLVRYVRLYSDRLPHEGKGRARRFHPQAVDAFRQLRSESGRGGRKPAGRKRGRPAGGGDAGVGGRLKVLEKSYQALEKRFSGLVKSLQKLVR